MARYHLTAPLSEADTAMLRSGDVVLLSGTVYTARDAAHARLAALLDQGAPLPFPLEGAVIYYVGPTPPPPSAQTVTLLATLILPRVAWL